MTTASKRLVFEIAGTCVHSTPAAAGGTHSNKVCCVTRATAPFHRARANHHKIADRSTLSIQYSSPF